MTRKVHATHGIVRFRRPNAASVPELHCKECRRSTYTGCIPDFRMPALRSISEVDGTRTASGGRCSMATLDFGGQSGSRSPERRGPDRDARLLAREESFHTLANAIPQLV